MKPSNCSSFMGKFQNYLKHRSSDLQFYDFENAVLTVNGVEKAKGGCDYAVLSNEGENCNLILVECKRGRLGVRDFEQGKAQLECGIRFIFNAFGKPPDLAVLCCEKLDPMVTKILQLPKNQRLVHNVPLIRKGLKESDCRCCR